MAPPNRPAPRQLTVMSKQFVSPNMVRVTLGGEGLDGFPADQQGGYIKLNLPNPDKPGKMLVRTYTIRAQRAGRKTGEIDVDFALHADTATGHAGPATQWAIAAQAGDTIPVGGPGPAKPLPDTADFYLVAGDMTALPAIAVNLAALPATARGFVAIEVMSQDDRIELDTPEGVEIHWLVNPQPGSQPDLLAEALRTRGWPEGQIHAWVAAEFSAMKALRTYLKDERQLGPEQLYISSYWKSGLNEDAHKLAKREDAQANAG